MYDGRERTYLEEKGLEHGYHRLPILRLDQFDGVGAILVDGACGWLPRDGQCVLHFLCQPGDRIQVVQLQSARKTNGSDTFDGWRDGWMLRCMDGRAEESRAAHRKHYYLWLLDERQLNLFCIFRSSWMANPCISISTSIFHRPCYSNFVFMFASDRSHKL